MRLARGDTVDQGTFNNNIRCIEMDGIKIVWKEGKMFNNNIRCIEIFE